MLTLMCDVNCLGDVTPSQEFEVLPLHAAMVHWAYGFVENNFEPGSLSRHRFPSKVGGRPSWLNPALLPSPSQLQCGASGKNLLFLLQAWSSLVSEELRCVQITCMLYLTRAQMRVAMYAALGTDVATLS